MTAIVWVMVRQRGTFYWRVAGIEPNNLQKTDLESRQQLWSNLLSSLWDRQPYNFMSIESLVMSLILPDSWRQAR